MQKLLQNINIGKNLQNLRLQKKLSQKDMVVKLDLRGRNMSVTAYGHIEQGRKNIFVSDLILFKEILGVKFDDFFEGLTVEYEAIPEKEEEE